MSCFIYPDSELQHNSKLVVCIEEKDMALKHNNIDNIIFIYYSNITNKYYITGKRQNILDKNYVPYFFNCDKIKHVYKFIKTILCYKSKIDITLYNYNNISKMDNNELTYDFFYEYKHDDYEIVSLDITDNNKIKNFVTNLLKMLTLIYN